MVLERLEIMEEMATTETRQETTEAVEVEQEGRMEQEQLEVLEMMTPTEQAVEEGETVTVLPAKTEP
jgi:hypothetical protein